jgi:hypothetical protein
MLGCVPYRLRLRFEEKKVPRALDNLLGFGWPRRPHIARVCMCTLERVAIDVAEDVCWDWDIGRDLIARRSVAWLVDTMGDYAHAI